MRRARPRTGPHVPQRPLACKPSPRAGRPGHENGSINLTIGCTSGFWSEICGKLSQPPTQCFRGPGVAVMRGRWKENSSLPDGCGIGGGSGGPLLPPRTDMMHSSVARTEGLRLARPRERSCERNRGNLNDVLNWLLEKNISSSADT